MTDANKDFPHRPAAFINAIREEGTKDEACESLQKIWNERCSIAAERDEIREERDDLARRVSAYEEMAADLAAAGGVNVMRRQMEMRRLKIRAEAAEAELASARAEYGTDQC
jgi:antitoxin component HigA of HigAB toxin-antitoxin module